LASSSLVASSSRSPIGSRNSAACRVPWPLRTPRTGPRPQSLPPALPPRIGASSLLPSPAPATRVRTRIVRSFTPRNGWSDGRQAHLVPRFVRIDGTNEIVGLGSECPVGRAFRRPRPVSPRQGRRNSRRFDGDEVLEAISYP